MRRFSAFFEENHSCVMSLARRRLGSHHDAEDLATEAFRLAWERYRSDGELSVPWLYQAVRNLIGNEYRRRERWRGTPVRIEDHCLVLSDESRLDVQDAVERLPMKYRTVVRMYYWEGFTCQEISSLLGLGASAIRMRLLRARDLLRYSLQEPENRPRDTAEPSKKESG